MQKIAIMGFGAMGQMHANCYQLISDAKVVGIVDAHPDSAQKTLEKLGYDYPVYPSLDELFAAQEVDAVDICLPTDLHVKFGLEVIAAGKNLFCEKPFAPTAEEGMKLVDAAAKANVLLMVGHCIRFWPEYKFLEETVKEQKYGKLLSLTMQRRASRPTYSNQNWLQNLARSGGAAYDLHIHDTDYILHLLGKPDAVTSVGTHDYSGWAHVFTTYHFKDVAVTAEGGWNYPEKFGFNMSWQAIFENGVLEFDFTKTPTLRLTAGDEDPKDIALEQAAGSAAMMTGNISDLGGYLHELKYWVECLATNTHPTISTGEQAAESVATVAAEVKSMEAGGATVKL